MGVPALEALESYLDAGRGLLEAKAEKKTTALFLNTRGTRLF